MLKIWAKVIANEKIVKDTVFERQEEFDVDNFFDYLSEICHLFDLETPVLLAKHVYHFVAFKNALFAKEDFTEQIDFDALVLEDVSNI